MTAWIPKEALPELPKIPISQPPCIRCKHWNPQPTFWHTDEGFRLDYMRLCHTDDMHHDFSCFKDKP